MEEEKIKESETKEEKNIQNKTLEETEKLIKLILNEGINENNLDFLGKVIDIHKDMSNEEYWKIKEENYMYRDYGNYGDSYGNDSYGRRGVKGTGRYSRYREGGSYGRRGVKGTGRGRYRGEEMLDEMYDNYQGYHEGKEEYGNSGNYGAKDESIESLDRMLKSIVYFMQCLDEDADSQEEKQLIQKYARKISEM